MEWIETFVMSIEAKHILARSDVDRRRSSVQRGSGYGTGSFHVRLFSYWIGLSMSSCLGSLLIYVVTRHQSSMGRQWEFSNSFPCYAVALMEYKSYSHILLSCVSLREDQANPGISVFLSDVLLCLPRSTKAAQGIHQSFWHECMLFLSSWKQISE